VQKFQDLSAKFADFDSKFVTDFGARVLENIVKSSDIIRKELEPSWASVVAKELDCKFEKMNKVASEVVIVQQTLQDVKSKAEDEKDKENHSLNIIIYRIEEVNNGEDQIKADKSFCEQLFRVSLV